MSKAIALMVSKDQLARPELESRMSVLCKDMADGMETSSPTEVAAFCEAARKMDFCTPGLAAAVASYLPGRVPELSGDEVPGMLWVVARLSAPDAAVVQALIDALVGGLDEVEPEELPAVVPLVAELAPAQPFALTALADAALRSLHEVSAGTLVALVRAFGAPVVLRSMFDDGVFKGLAAEAVLRAPQMSAPDASALLSAFREACPRHATLTASLANVEAALACRSSLQPES